MRQRLERLAGRRLTRDGVVLLAQGETQAQKRNREEADRLMTSTVPRREEQDAGPARHLEQQRASALVAARFIPHN